MPGCLTRELSTGIGESCSRGGGNDISSVILADQPATNFSPGSSVASPMSFQSACGHSNGRNPGGGTVESSRISFALGSSISCRIVPVGSLVRLPLSISDTLAQKKPVWSSFSPLVHPSWESSHLALPPVYSLMMGSRSVDV